MVCRERGIDIGSAYKSTHDRTTKTGGQNPRSNFEEVLNVHDESGGLV